MEFGLGDHGGLESLGHQVYLLSPGVCRTEGRVSCHPPSSPLQGLPGKDGETGAAGPPGPAVSTW